MRTLLLAVAALSSIVGLAQAEVRIVPMASGPALDVRPVARGIWTPRLTTDRAILNPSGDLLRDGYPSHATREGRGLASWLRPATSQLVLQELGAAGPLNQIVVPVEFALGIPVMASSAGGSWIVAWARGGPTPGIEAVAGDPTRGYSAALHVQDGLLVDSARLPSGLLLVSVDVDASELVLGRVVTGFHPTPIPIPIPLLRVPLHLRSLAPSGASAAPSRVTAAASVQAPCVAENAEGTVTVAWRPDPRQIVWVNVSDDHIDGPHFMDGPNGSCQALLRATNR